MVTVVGLGEASESVVLCLPIEVTAVDNATAYSHRMSVHILCCRVCHYVCSPLDRAAVDRCGTGVVYDKGYSVAVCNVSELLNVEHVNAGV